MIDHLVVCVSGQRYRRTIDPPELLERLQVGCQRVADLLVDLVVVPHTLVVVVGGAPGVDMIIEDMLKVRGAHVAVVEALWGRYNAAAGGYRNSAMLALRPTEWRGIHTDWAVARGTTNCERQAKALGIPTRRHDA